MSYCRKEGKDQIIFVTKGDYDKQTPENPLLPGNEEPVGLIKENGEINWDCPCLQGMADGPCGEPFKDAFSCFHYSEAEPKGVDCLEQFKSMQECFVKHPDVYGGLDDDLKEEEENGNSTTATVEEIAVASDDTTEETIPMSEAVSVTGVSSTSSEKVTHVLDEAPAMLDEAPSLITEEISNITIENEVVASEEKQITELDHKEKSETISNTTERLESMNVRDEK